MDELADRFQFIVTGDLFLQEVLHRLDIMVGGALDVLDALRILFAELLDNIVQQIVGMAR